MKQTTLLGTALGALMLAGTTLAGGCSGGSGDHKAMTKVESPHATGNIVEVASKAGTFSTLLAAAKAAGLVEALQGDGPLTVFAPNDEAFAKLPKGTVENLLKPENKAMLASILTYHVVPGRVLAKDVASGGVATLNGQRLDVKAASGSVMVDGAKVIATDVMASNGVIHVIDSVVMPSSKSIVQTALDAGQFKTLAMLLEKASLVGALEGEGPFTVFAPTDEAFAKIPKETLESLLKPENREMLAGILKYHVVPGRVFSDAAAKGATVKTLEGSTVTTKSQGGSVMVGKAKVVAADIDAKNGVIHVIETVIMPEKK